ncbi:translation initiation factor eif-2b beta subunit [Plasmopara halstedii]|uniref:Translation initiation factor eIF2B subunit beta n=1 Tax=Plasmopara halstedii TaxID=4781 RepID=A0A0P1ADI7_PLAHL|nr:translation initiation factor eif-2b beta subunit [Plasmopara halstedii]CEG38866.1 translation initiation factor eif-2b beta subunit [Plasmopara halstedii]|eukprot:XP_024575235.1 translation initiation factor eif-2b beta subunit [Plasmopara halstedii]
MVMKELKEWLDEWPAVREVVDDLVLSLKRRQLHGSYETAKMTTNVLCKVLETVEWSTAGEILEKIRQLGYMLTTAHTHELVIGNVVRRVLYIIREEHLNALKVLAPTTGTSPPATHTLGLSSNRNNNLSRSLDTILTPGTDTDLSIPITDLKLSVMEGIAELVDEIENLHVNIADQAMEYIHTDEVILTFGLSLSVEAFLKTAAKKRSFKVIVVESAPSLNGQNMAHVLAESGIHVTVIPDSAVYALMARVNKVVVPAAAVVANGGLIAQSGLQNIALAAKKCSVPVVCVAGLIKLSPLYAHDLDVLSELLAPSSIYNYEDIVDNLEVLNPAYDYVPPECVMLLITNTGAHQPSYIYRLLAEYYSPQDYQLS